MSKRPKQAPLKGELQLSFEGFNVAKPAFVGLTVKQLELNAKGAKAVLAALE